MTTSAWIDIISSADKFRDALALHIRVGSLQTTEQAQQAPPLDLPDVDSQSLHQALFKRNLSSASILSLIELYERRAREVQQSFRTKWRELGDLVCLGDSLTSVRRASIAALRRGVTGLEQSILAVVDKRLHMYKLDAEASAQSEVESSSEDGLLIPRGHSKLAVKILELAYSRTTNISRAEKIRLAAATKLEPRQVTIWFQNRRNRKVASAAPKIKQEFCSPSELPETPLHQTRKRKADGLYDGELRQPSQRMRTSTPDNTPSADRSVYLSGTFSSSSVSSSVDSLASFSRGVTAKGRNYSTDSSEAGLEDGSPTHSSVDKKGSLLTVSSFDDQMKHQTERLQFNIQSEEDAASSLLFSDSGVTQLDFDDLGIDLDSLMEDLPGFSMDAFDFSIPQPSALLSRPPTNTQFDLIKTSSQSTFAVPQVPTSAFDVATILNGLVVDASEEVKRAQQIEEWAFGMGTLWEEDEDNNGSCFLNLQGNQSSSSDEASTNGNESSVATPQDPFDFSLQGLCIDRIMDHNLETYQDMEQPAFPSKSQQDLSLDIEAANEYSLDDVLTTAREFRQEYAAR